MTEYERLAREAISQADNTWPESRRDAREPSTNGTNKPAERVDIEGFTVGELIDRYPRLHPPVVDGLLRQGETLNVISWSKAGKSWLVYGFGLSVLTGRPWLDRFATSQGRVLLIDNELHKPTIASRIRTVADALAIPLGEYRDKLEVWPLRGKLRNICDLRAEVERMRGFKVIIIDAKYRMMPAGASENDNAQETFFYNAIDQYAEATGAAFVLVHHSSKGSQSEKRITDVGAGAGAQSRAADCHLVLREHEQEDIVVFEAVVRSFPPIEPLALRWAFPLWVPTAETDPSRLKGRLTQQEQRQAAKDQEDMAKILGALNNGPRTVRQLRDLGIGADRLTRLLGTLESQGKLT